jgi:hypothetical protein
MLAVASHLVSRLGDQRFGELVMPYFESRRAPAVTAVTAV